jgi:hypothetical protein
MKKNGLWFIGASMCVKEFARAQWLFVCAAHKVLKGVEVYLWPEEDGSSSGYGLAVGVLIVVAPVEELHGSPARYHEIR